MSAAYARPLTDAVTVGFGVKLISQKIDRISLSGFAFYNAALALVYKVDDL